MSLPSLYETRAALPHQPSRALMNVSSRHPIRAPSSTQLIRSIIRANWVNYGWKSAANPAATRGCLPPQRRGIIRLVLLTAHQPQPRSISQILPRFISENTHHNPNIDSAPDTLFGNNTGFMTIRPVVDFVMHKWYKLQTYKTWS